MAAARWSGLTLALGQPQTLQLAPDHTPLCFFVFILVKAGGMRIVQKHPHSGDTKEERDKDDQEWESPRWESSRFTDKHFSVKR